MKSKVFMLLVMATVGIAAIALNYQNASASARCRVIMANAETMAAAGCKNCDCVPLGGLDQDQGVPPQTSSVMCGPNNNNTWASAKATASRILPTEPGGPEWKAVIEKQDIIHWQDWAWGKGEKQSILVVTAFDSVMITRLGPGVYTLHHQGTWTIFLPPDNNAPNAWISEIVKVYPVGDPNNPLFSGTITLNGGRETVTGDYLPGGPPSFVYDTVPGELHIDFWTNFVYGGDINDLVLFVWGPDRGANVPTTTFWGILVLVALIVASGVFVMVKRRRVTATA